MSNVLSFITYTVMKRCSEVLKQESFCILDTLEGYGRQTNCKISINIWINTTNLKYIHRSHLKGERNGQNEFDFLNIVV